MYPTQTESSSTYIYKYLKQYLGVDIDVKINFQEVAIDYDLILYTKIPLEFRDFKDNPYDVIQKKLNNIFKLEQGQWYKNIKRQHEKEIERLKSEHELQLETLRTELENKNDILTCKNDELMEEIREVSCKRLSLTEYVEQTNE